MRFASMFTFLQRSVVQFLGPYIAQGAIVVTQPQSVSLVDVRKEIAFCRTVKLKILGLIENMSGFVCPHCSACTNVWGSGGGEALSKELEIAFLGRIPIDPNVAKQCDVGTVADILSEGVKAAWEGIVESVMKAMEE